MKNLVTLLLIILAMHPVVAVNVTFKVDMSAYTDFDKNVDSLTIFGGFNGWDNKADVLTDVDDDNVYEIILDLNSGDAVEYKYVIIDGDGEDDIYGDVSGAAAYAGTNNRAFRVPSVDYILEPVTFNACNGIDNGMVSVVFQLDMSAETVSADGVHIVGDFSGKAWWTDAFSLDENSAGVYLDTINMLPGDVLNYKFINGASWDGQETVIPDAAKYGDNRGGVVPSAVNQDYTLPVTTFNGSPALYDVDFKLTSDDGKLELPTINVFNRTLTVHNGTDTTIALAQGYYPYSVTAVGYYGQEGDFFVDTEAKTVDLELITATKSIDFSIADSTNVAPNTSLRIASSHPLLSADGSELTNDNITSFLSFTQTGGAVGFFATINDTKNEITLIPNVLLASNTEFEYGIQADKLKYEDNDAVESSLASFTTKTYSAQFTTYENFDGEDAIAGFYTKGADDHVGAIAQPYYTSLPASGNNKALKYAKGTGSWGGWGKLEIDLDVPMDLETGKIISFDVYAAKACKVRVALTDSDNSEGDIQVETGDDAPADVYITKVNEWQTIYVDFTKGKFNDSVGYRHILFCFDAGVDEDNIFYIDNIQGPKLSTATGIEPISTFDEINVYPNPSQDYITIASGQDISMVEIYSVTGLLVNTIVANNVHETTVDISALPQGLYVVKAFGENLHATSTITVK